VISKESENKEGRTEAQIFEDKDTNFEKVITDIEKDFTQNLDKFTLSNQKSYFWRLFSIHNKKIGRDVYPFVAMVQSILAVYIMIFYTAIESGSLTESITTSLRYNEFSGAMVVMLFLQIGFILVDRGIVLINSNKIKEVEQEEKTAYGRNGFKDFLVGSDINMSKKRKFQRELKKTFEHEIQEEHEHEDEDDHDHDDDHNKNERRKKDEKKDENFSKDLIFDLMKIPFHFLVPTKSLSKEAFHKYATFSKYVLHISLLISFHIFIYWFLPKSQGVFCPLCSTTSMWFYILYSVYFTLSAYQLKSGIPEFKGRMVLMEGYSPLNQYAFIAYKSMPFFFEIKTFMDWTFTDTALNVFQWLKFEDIYGTLFVSKITSDLLFVRRLGEKINKISKFTVGFCGIVALLLLILGPLLLFSTYNPFGTDNFVTAASISLGFQVNQNYFPIFQNSHVSYIKPLTSDEYTNAGFSSQSVLRDVDQSRIQNVTMAPYSDTTWSIALPSYQSLLENLADLETLIGTTSNLKNLGANTGINITMTYQFSQEQNIKNNIQSTSNSETYVFLNSTDRTELLKITELLKNTVNCSGIPIKISSFYNSIIRLGSNQAPTSYAGDSNRFKKDVFFELVCQKDNDVVDISSSYWRVTVDNSNTGLILYTMSNKVSSFLINFSVSAFYITVVYLVGQSVRSAFSGQAHTVMMNDLPAAVEILQICEGILIARADKNLQKEELMYWELIDLLRSPEVLKIITQSGVEKKTSKVKKLKTD